MEIRDRIRELSGLPSRFNIMLEQGLLVVEDDNDRKDLCEVACVVSSAAWKEWLSEREPEDNRQEHEWVVFANVMKIAEAENLPLSDRRIATAFTFTHDSHFIPRIMEQEIRDAKTDEQKRALEEKKEDQRQEHMRKGAENAESLLPTLTYAAGKKRRLFKKHEIDTCVEIVSKHDCWKLRDPSPPPTRDRLALSCIEGDALWPLHPLGVLADLERPNEKGKTHDFSDPAIWHTQLQQSNKTLVEARSKWEGIPAGAFIDSESIFRTREGWRLYNGWRKRWSLQGA